MCNAIDNVPLVTPAAVTRRIIAEVGKETGLSPAVILGRSRIKPVILARREAIRRLVEQKPHLSYPMIAKLFSTDHGSIIEHMRRSGCWRPRAKVRPDFDGANVDGPNVDG